MPMLFSTRIASIFFAAALIGWGIMHFIAGDFMAGRAPSWPEGLPGKIVWAYASGLLLIVAAFSIIFPNQKTRWTVTCTGLLILAWAGARTLVIVLPALDYGGNLTNLGKSLTIGSGALLIGTTLTAEPKKYIYVLCCFCTGIFFLASGIQHFIFIEFVKTLVPRWIPGDVFWSYVAGIGLAATGIALITGFKRKLAALVSAWMVFIWFLILHVPRGFGEGANLNEWIAIFEALAVSAILATIYWKSDNL